MFLDGARIHLACCAPKEQMELVRICREGAATRHVDLLAAVTHIVVSVACCPSSHAPRGPPGSSAHIVVTAARCLLLSGKVKRRGCRPAAVGCHEPCRALAFQVLSRGQAASKLLLSLLLASSQGMQWMSASPPRQGLL